MAGVLLPYQMQWINDPTPVRVYEKSRRIGISWSTAAEAALVAAAASGMDVWYIGYNKDMAEEFIRDSADWIGHYQLVAEAVSEEILNDGDKDILTFVIRCASGYRITAEISVYIAADARGKGLGRRLVKFILESAPKFGIKNVVALIFSSNAASLNLFAKFGFTRWGELPEVCDMGGKIESLTILGKKLG